jgi:hypothetical protein
MWRAVIGCVLLLASATPADAEFSPAQKLVILLESWRVRAVDCRSRYVSFSGPEVAALTDLVISSSQVAKFDPNDLNEVMRWVSFQLSNGPPPTKEVCDQMRKAVFGIS